MKILKGFLLISLFIISFLAGISTYKATLWYGWEQAVGSDLNAILFWSILAYGIVLVPLYLYVCAIVRTRQLNPYIKLALYPFACAALFILPTAFMMMFFGGGRLISAEAQLFYAFFASSGVVFGLGYGAIQGLSRRYRTV
ncbi:hypothetical protein [Paenibacillus sp. 481]|uniref:hypothetical protein n=1 Tax=Paenibacillus sp. 481 TaxID=2835869 RepID=UPI001E4A5DE4|nr:hypothetical protein [Paenibacillus sp. 481]UHA72731.1 hypothetical protein KIK04_19165 [Paenibacillus sp. 481]